MNKVYTVFPGGKAKALTMSYDDGKQEDRRLVDIFNANGIKGTFNINYDAMLKDTSGDRHPRLLLGEVKDLYRGHEIASHTMTHPTIERCPLSEVAWEVLEDRKGLESITKAPVRGMAYPNGSYNEDIKALLKQLGIAYSRVVESVSDFKLPTDPYEWHPTAHHEAPDLMEKAEFFANFGKRQYLRLMYVWGHSYEFAEHDNWEVIEKFSEFMGGRDDIWYATNIEIIDYMENSKRLQFAADNSFVYNPSAVTVCLMINDKNYVEVGPGEIKTLD